MNLHISPNRDLRGKKLNIPTGARVLRDDNRKRGDEISPKGQILTPPLFAVGRALPINLVPIRNKRVKGFPQFAE